MLVNVNYTYNGKKYSLEAELDQKFLSAKEDNLKDKIQDFVKIILQSCPKNELAHLTKIELRADRGSLYFDDKESKNLKVEVFKKLDQANNEYDFRSSVVGKVATVVDFQGLKDIEILDNFDDSTDWVNALESTDLSMLFTITGDRFGVNNFSLEGNTSKHVVNYVTSFINLNLARDSLSKDAISAETLAQLERLQNLEITEKHYTDEIEWSIRENKPVLLFGGWSSRGHGHAILYEVLPQIDGTVNFRIYNSGEGIQYKHPTGLKGHKEKIAPIEWQGITSERIQDPYFHLAMMNLFSVIDKSTKLDPNWEAKHIYKGFKKMLKPTKQVTLSEISPSQFLGPQSAGTCSFKCILAYLKTKLPQDTYRKLICDLKLTALEKGVKSLRMRDDINWKRDIHLIEKSLQGVLASILKLHQQGKISSQYLHDAEKKIDSAIDKIAQLKFLTPIVAPNIPKMTPVTFFTIPLTAAPPYQSIIDDTENISATHLKTFSSMPEKVRELDWKVPANISASLATLLDATKAAVANNENQLVINQIHKVMSKWSVDPGFWKEACGSDPAKAELLLSQMAEMNDLFSFAVMKLNGIDPRFNQHMVFYLKLLNIEKQLAEVICPKSAELGLGEFKFHFLDKNKETFKYDKQASQTLFNAFPDSSFVNGMFQLSEVLFKVQSPRIIEYTNDELACMRVEVKKDLLTFVSDTYPKLIQDIIKKNPEFQKMKRSEQVGLVYADPGLPAWFKIIRNTLFSFTNVSIFGNTPELSGDSIPEWTVENTTSWHSDNGECNVYLKSASKQTHNLYGEYKAANSKANARGFIYENHSAFNQRNTLRPFKNSKFNEWLKYLPHVSSNEKWLQSVDFKTTKVPEWSEEEFKEFTHLCLSWLQPLETIEYFSKHPDKLKDTDYQQILQLFLFKPNAIENFLMKPLFKVKLEAFITSTYKEFQNQNVLQPMIFLLGFQRQLKDFGYCSQDDLLSELRRLAALPNISETEKALIYSEIAANFNSKEKLEENDVKDLIIACGFEYSVKIPAEWQDPLNVYAMRETLQIHHQAIMNYLSDPIKRNQIMNEISSLGISNPEKIEWKLVEDKEKVPYVQSSNGKVRFNPLSGVLEFINVSQKIPYSILVDFDFKKLFPHIKEAKLLANGAYYFLDDKGNKTYVKQTSTGKLHIEQLWPDQKNSFVFYSPTSMINEEHTYANHTRYTFLCKDLVTNYSHWKENKPHTETSLVFLKSASGLLEYVSELDSDGIKSITRLKDGLKLSVVSQRFQKIEESAFIHEWYKGEELAEVELPRLGLTFKPDSKNPDHLLCQQSPGYYIDLKALPEKIDSLGHYESYLVLDSDKNGKRLVMSDMVYKAPLKQEALEPFWLSEFNLVHTNPGSVASYTFNVNPITNELTSTSQSGHLFLAHAYLLVANYAEVSKIMDLNGEKLGPYTKEEIKSLENMMALVTGDNSPNAAAIKIKACLFLLKNNEKYNSPIDLGKTLNSTSYKMKTYLNLMNKVTVPKLRQNDEIFLLGKLLNSHKYDPQLHARIENLDPESASELKAELPKIVNRTKLYSLPANLTQPKENTITAPTTEKWNSVLFASPGSFILQHFLYFYCTAQGVNNSAYSFWLKSALIFMKLNEAHAPYAHILEAVFKHPEKFPKIVTGSESITSFDFLSWEKIRMITNSLQKEKVETTHEQTIPTKISVSSISPEQPIATVAIQYKLDKALFSDLNQQVKDANLFEANEGVRDITGLETLRGMLKEKSLDSELDPQAVSELKRLQMDIDAYKGKIMPQQYSIDKNSSLDQWIPKVQKFVDGIKSDLNKVTDLDKLQIEILGIANSVPKEATAKLIRKYQRLGEHYRPLTIQDLIVNFALQSPQDLIRRNPVLNEELVNVLFSKIHTYLLLKTQIQQVERIQGALNNLTTNKDENLTKDLIQTVCEQLDAKRSYNPIKESPEFLVFEYFFDSFLREAQVNKIRELISGKLSDSKTSSKDIQNLIVEMIPGSGKSKVLLPLIGLLRAKTGKLSMVVVPAALLETVSSDTQNIMQGYAKRLHDLPFDRNSPMDLNSLRRIRNELKSIQANQDCLVMTSSNIEALMLKLIELSIVQFNSKTLTISDEFKLVREIISLLRTNGHPLIDEVDSIINVLQEMCYSVGSKNAPPQWETEVIGNLYKTIEKNEAIKKLVKFECLRDSNPQAEMLTDSNLPAFQQLVANSFISGLSVFELKSNPLLQKEFRDYGKSITADNKRILTNYLLRDIDNVVEAQAYFNQLPPNIQDIVALAGEEISSLLPHTLQKICNKKYGLDNDLIPIPYAASNKPSKGSQFANEHITMNYAMQYYIIKGISKEILESALERMQKEINTERKGNKSLAITDTEGWKRFKAVTGDLDFPIFNMNEQQMTQLLKHVNSFPDGILRFVENSIIPYIEIYEGKINCNPLNLIDLFTNGATGFTGTLWNSASMHSKLTAVPEAGTDAKTISLLWDKSRDSIISITQGSSKELLDQFAKNDFDMIADAGGYFREKKVDEVAKELSILKSKPVLYYSSAGAKMITDGKGVKSLAESGLKTGEFLTLLDEGPTTGADVPQKADAVSLVTIGRDMLLRDLLQSVWRLRGLEKSQKPVFVLSDEVEALIRQSIAIKPDQKIRFDEILLYCIKNQARRQGDDNFKALKDEMWGGPKMLVFDILLRDDIPLKIVEKVFEYAKKSKLWMEAGYESPRTRYGVIARKIESSKAVKEEKSSYDTMVKDMFLAIPELVDYGYDKNALLENGNRSTGAREKQLPKEVYRQNNDKELSMQKMKEIEKKQQTELEVNVQLQRALTTLDCAWGENYVYEDKLPAKIESKAGEFNTKTPIIPMRAYMETDAEFKDFVSEFGDIRMAINVLEWEAGKFKKTCKLFGAGRTPLHFLDIEGDNVTILAQKDGVALQAKPGFYNLTLGFINEEVKLSPEVSDKIVKIKFLNGDSNFTETELQVIRGMVDRLGLGKVRDFYEKVCLRGYPSKRVEYLDSRLKKILNN